LSILSESLDVDLLTLDILPSQHQGVRAQYRGCGFQLLLRRLQGVPFLVQFAGLLLIQHIDTARKSLPDDGFVGDALDIHERNPRVARIRLSLARRPGTRDRLRECVYAGGCQGEGSSDRQEMSQSKQSDHGLDGPLAVNW
jgi:hypothetical protein